MFRAHAIALLCLGLAAAPAALAKPAKASHGLATHVIQPGQTLGMIAKRYNVSIEAVCTANGIRRTDPIKPKQRLVIPDRKDKDGSEARERVAKANATAKEAPSAKDDKPKKADKKAEAKPARTTSKQKKPGDEGYAKKPKKRGYIVISGPNGSWKGYAVGRDGKVTGAARDGFEKVLASWRTGKRERIHGRLIRMLTKVSDHFGGRPIRIVSGFRPFSNAQYTPHSRHNLGRAVDFSVQGVPNEVVRDFCRTLHNVGVGYYPNSSFVHLDVREVPTYWVDYSGPGQAPRYANSRGRDPAKDATTNASAPGGSSSTPAEPTGI